MIASGDLHYTSKGCDIWGIDRLQRTDIATNKQTVAWLFDALLGQQKNKQKVLIQWFELSSSNVATGTCRGCLPKIFR